MIAKPDLEELNNSAALWYCKKEHLFWISLPNSLTSWSLNQGLSFWTESSYLKKELLQMRDVHFILWLNEDQVMLNKDQIVAKEPWFQDIGKPLDGSNEEYFYKAGYASYTGRSRFHAFRDCRYLVHGKPDWLEGIGVFRATYDKGFIEENRICKTCLKRRKS